MKETIDKYTLRFNYVGQTKFYNISAVKKAREIISSDYTRDCSLITGIQVVDNNNIIDRLEFINNEISTVCCKEDEEWDIINYFSDERPLLVFEMSSTTDVLYITLKDTLKNIKDLSIDIITKRVTLSPDEKEKIRNNLGIKTRVVSYAVNNYRFYSVYGAGRIYKYEFGSCIKLADNHMKTNNIWTNNQAFTLVYS